VKKILFPLAAIFFGLLPFHPFLKTAFSLPPIFAAWKEIFIVIFFLAAVFKIWKNRKTFRADFLDFSIFVFVFWSLLTGILWTGDATGHFFPQNIPQIVFGVKYGLLFLIAFFAFRHLNFSEKQKSKLFKIAILSAAIAIFFGVAQKTLLPENFLTKFHYSAEYGKTEVGDGALSYCHKIEKKISQNEFCRVQSTFSGPNQFAAFLLIFLPMFFYGVLRAKKVLPAALFLMLFLAGGFDLIFAFSRSAWIGAMFAAAAFFVISAKSPRAAFFHFLLFCGGVAALFFPVFFLEKWDELKIFAIFAAGIFAAILLFSDFFAARKNLFSPILGAIFPAVLGVLILARAFFDTFFWNILFRPSSTNGHFERMADAISAIFQNPFGLGLGDAGPASARFAAAGQTGFLPESWFLQVGLESGFLGLFLFVAILFLTGQKLFSSKNEFAAPLFLALVGLSGMALFLHSFESAAVAFSFWGLAGLAIADDKKENVFQKLFRFFKKFSFQKREKRKK